MDSKVSPLDRYVLFLSVSFAAGIIRILFRFLERTANCRFNLRS